MRLDRALSERFPEHSRSALARLIEEGHVRIDGQTAKKPSQRVEADQRIDVDFPAPAPATIEAHDLPLRILHEDEDLVVIDKPAGLVVHPAAGHRDQTLVNALLFTVKDLSGIGGEIRPGIVHRLDKDTSGVMVIAKNDATHRALTTAWNTDAVRKEYIAVVYGTPTASKGTIDAPIGRDPRDRKRMAVVAGGRKAITDYEVIERLRYASVLRPASAPAAPTRSASTSSISATPSSATRCTPAPNGAASRTRSCRRRSRGLGGRRCMLRGSRCRPACSRRACRVI